MAEIRVERKTGPGKWLWLVVVLVVVAGVLFYLWQAGILGGTDTVAEQVMQQLVPVEAVWHATNLG